MFNDFSINLFNENKVVLNLLLIKNEKENIYSDDKAENIFTDTSYINYKLVSVDKIVSLGTEYLYKVNYSNKIKGYIHTNDCLVFIPKESEQIRFKDNVQFHNDLNDYFELKTDIFDEAKYKICYSKNRIVYNNRIYEGIYLADKFLGFFKSTDLYKLIKIARDFNIIEECTLFKDSFLSREVLITKPSKTILRSSMIIKELGIVRFKLNGKNLWMDIKNTDLILDDGYSQPLSISDALITSIIYQYHEKLEKSHRYYHKFLTQELQKKG